MNFKRNKALTILGVTLPVIAAAIIGLFLVSGSASGRPSDTGKENRTGITSFLDFWNSGGSGRSQEEIPGLDEEQFAKLPPAEQRAYKEYLKRLQKDVETLKYHLEGEKPDFPEIYSKFMPERMEAMREPLEKEIDPERRDTPEGRAFLEKRRKEQKEGHRATRLEMLHILMQRYSPRLTEEERSKITQEIAREEGNHEGKPVGIKGVYP